MKTLALETLLPLHLVVDFESRWKSHGVCETRQQWTVHLVCPSWQGNGYFKQQIIQTRGKKRKPLENNQKHTNLWRAKGGPSVCLSFGHKNSRRCR
jgi:hypothetical protein